MALMIQTSTGSLVVLPSRRTTCSSSTLRSFAWSAAGSSPISSRKIVPRWAVWKSPAFARRASVNEAGDQALARPRLALDQDGRHPAAGMGARQQAADVVPQRLDGGAFAEDLVKACHRAPIYPGGRITAR